MPVHVPSLTEIIIAVCTVCSFMLHTLAFGHGTLRRLQFRASHLTAQIVVMASIGTTLFGFFIWILGHLGALNRNVFVVTTCMSIAYLFTINSPRDKIIRLREGLLHFAREDHFLFFLLLSLIAVAVMSGLRGSGFEDDYKWGSPLLWAKAGRWVASPFRISNGMELVEVIYSFAAVFSSLTAAHWIHATLWLLLLLGGAALAQQIGASRIASVSAIAAVPVISCTAATANTDLPFATLLIAACVAVLCRNEEPEKKFSNSTLIVTGLLLAGAVSSKSIAVIGMFALTLYIIRTEYMKHLSTFYQNVKRIVSYVVFPVFITVCLWSLHTYRLIGKFWDNSGQKLVRTPLDPMWATGEASGRIPSLHDILLLPFIPLFATLFGQREPYGARIGLLTIIFLPIGLYFATNSSTKNRHKIFGLLWIALINYFVLSPVAIKIRFFIFTWAMFCVIGAYGYTQIKEKTGHYRKAILILFYLLVMFGIADSVFRKMLLPG